MDKSTWKYMKNMNGFTLVELIVVIAIIAILTAIATPTFSKYIGKAREATCLTNRRSLQSEVELCLITEPEDSCVSPGMHRTDDILDGYTCPAGGKLSYLIMGTTVSVICSAHNSITPYLQSVSDWIKSYSGDGFGNNYVDAFVREHNGTGIQLSESELNTLFAGASFAVAPDKLYLKPLGATVYDQNGKASALDIQLITNVPGLIGKNADLNCYGLIIDGKVYAMKDADGNIVNSTRVAGNGTEWLNMTDYNVNNRMYDDTQSFIDYITSTTSGRKYPFVLSGGVN